VKRSTIGHVATALLRQIEALVRIDGQDREKTILIIEDVEAIDWASLTFVGQRHVLELRIEGEKDAVAAALARIETGLPELEVSIPGHFVAELRAEARPVADTEIIGLVRSLRVEALVLRD
jgi:phenylpyruvate tautomerase PptA (4-oxalocrotonate tautomerase family)